MPAPSSSTSPEYFIGMISGTSRDGADVALVAFEEDQPRLEQVLCLPYPEEIATTLQSAIETGRRPEPDILESLDLALGNFFAGAANSLLDRAGVHSDRISAIGSHGQTVWHEPPESLQLGDPAIIASQTGITTVSGFRQADLDAGGEGAPLAPLLHRAVFRPEIGALVVLNLGGIANVSCLDANGNVTGFDTGPSNCLLDAWIRKAEGRAFDEGGQWAAGGRVIAPVLMTLLEDPYFSHLPPKSTGVEYFNLRWLEAAVEVAAFAPEDIQATLAELTARTVAASIPENAMRVLVCGGGVHNTDLLRRLREQLPGREVASTADSGIDPNAVEAMLFAWLARERLANRAQDTTSITGASEPVLLGTIHHPN
jgi:anhydro-N-acetylmuramic acid kinase